ncbi:MAG: prepilin peptidase [Polyangiaceae bacterium]
MLLSDFPTWFVRSLGIIMGLLWGSFLNVVIYRVPAGLSVVKPASHCPACKKPVAAYDNIPVLSWLILRGRARCCGVKISARYPAVELLCGLLGWAIVEWLVLGLPPETRPFRGLMIYIADLALALGLVAATFIDLEHLQHIPGRPSHSGATVVGFATASLRPPLGQIDSGIGAVGGFLMVWLPFDLSIERSRTGDGDG